MEKPPAEMQAAGLVIWVVCFGLDVSVYLALTVIAFAVSFFE